MSKQLFLYSPVNYVHVLMVFNTSALLTIPWWIWKAELFQAPIFINLMTLFSFHVDQVFVSWGFDGIIVM